MSNPVAGGFPEATETGRRPARCRPGLSLVELLVVVAIVGVLVAMILPAVAAQRETARRTQCVSRLRQVGIGLHAYHESHSTFPSGHVAETERAPDGKSWGWAALLLPFVDENPLSDQLDPARRSLDDVVSDRDGLQRLQASVDVYRCPSDTGGALSHAYRSLFIQLFMGGGVSSSAASGNELAGTDPLPPNVLAHINPPLPDPPPPDVPPDQPPPPQAIQIGINVARSNFVASIGSRWKPQRDDWSATDFRGDGLFGRNSRVQYSEIPDGTSKTLAVGERCDRNYAAVWVGANSWQGCGFVDNQMVLGAAFYPINDAPISQNLDCDGQGAANFSSYHPGGANFLFADGSVRFLDERVDQGAFRALAGRDDGENVGDF